MNGAQKLRLLPPAGPMPAAVNGSLKGRTVFRKFDLGWSQGRITKKFAARHAVEIWFDGEPGPRNAFLYPQDYVSEPTQDSKDASWYMPLEDPEPDV